MAALSPAHEKRLQELRADYAARLDERISSLLEGLEEALVASSAEKARWSRLQELAQVTHRLCGSAAIFGFSSVSDAARGIEDALLALLEDRANARVHRRAVKRRLESLKSALRQEDVRPTRPR